MSPAQYEHLRKQIEDEYQKKLAALEMVYQMAQHNPLPNVEEEEEETRPTPVPQRLSPPHTPPSTPPRSLVKIKTKTGQIRQFVAQCSGTFEVDDITRMLNDNRTNTRALVAQVLSALKTEGSVRVVDKYQGRRGGRIAVYERVAPVNVNGSFRAKNGVGEPQYA